MVANENNELIPTRVTSGWRVCIDYRKLNAGTRKDHFPLPFVDQMLERVVGHEFYCFLDGYSGYNQIKIALEDQEKTTFTYPFGTFAFRKMPFGLCNTLGTGSCVMEFKGSWDTHLPLMEFAYNNSYQASISMAPYEALYGRKCRTPVCWDEVGERKLVGSKIVQVTCDKIKVIRDRLKIAQDRHKSYANNRRRDLEFEVGDMVFLRISPWKGVLRFGKRGKPSPRYIGPYRIVERIGEVAYQLEFPSDLDRIHDVFHVSMLRKYIPDPSHVLTEQPVEIQKNLTYEEELVQILDRREQILRNKTIPLVKVFWRSHAVEEATWDPKAQMRRHYPQLFS